MKIINLEMLQNEISKKYSVFICSSSFEQRCASVCSVINSNKLIKAFIIYNREYKSYLKYNLNKQKKILAPHYSLVETSLKDPLLTADNMKENIIDYIIKQKPKNILLDITTFSHEGLLILLKLLMSYCPFSKISCVYTNAREYSVGDEIGQKWLSKGIEEVRAVLGYTGNLIPSKKTHLFLIVGYEYERAISLINMIEPNVLSLGYGKSENATVEKNKEANLHYSNLVSDMSPSYPEINKFEISCNDPYKTYKCLEKQIRKYKDDNILIVPMNNKISTIGAGLLALKNERIQVCYGPALTYNILNYSTTGSKYYIFDIDLEEI